MAEVSTFVGTSVNFFSFLHFGHVIKNKGVKTQLSKEGGGRGGYKQPNMDMHLKKFEMLNAMQAKQPNAWQLVAALIDQKKWNEEVFCKRCGLDANAFFKAQRGDPSRPTLNTLMAICVGAEAEMPAAEILLGAAGIKLSASIPLHRAYMSLNILPVSRFLCAMSSSNACISKNLAAKSILKKMAYSREPQDMPSAKINSLF